MLRNKPRSNVVNFRRRGIVGSHSGEDRDTKKKKKKELEGKEVEITKAE